MIGAVARGQAHGRGHLTQAWRGLLVGQHDAPGEA